MKLFLIQQPAIPASAYPYRLVDDQEHEITWANDFLDAQRIRQLSLRSLRAYGYDLLHFARWCVQHPSRTLLEMDESSLLDYVRDQLNQEPQPTPQTINHRLGVLRSVYRFHSGHPMPPGTCNASSISPAKIQYSLTTFPNFLSPVPSRPAPICPAFGVPWPRLAISWRCIVARSKTKKPAATYSAWISAFPQSSLNSIDSPQPKNEERLAG